MKALTLTQPWAQLIADGRKHIETRSWPTSYRGEIAIHAAKGWTSGDRDCAETYGYKTSALPLGAIVAVAHLHVCHPTEAFTSRMARPELSVEERDYGNFDPGRFGWLLTGVRKLRVPVPCKGALGLWTVPAGVRFELVETLS